MEMILCVGAILIWGILFCWMVFMLYTVIRNDRRNERERKARLAREAELVKKLNR